MVSRETDATDLAIIEQLEQNSKQTLSEIAERVSLSAPAVKRRIDRLEEAGVISGYTIRVDHALLGRPLEAFIELRFDGSTSVDQMIDLASDTPEVEAIFTIAGDPDSLVLLRVENVDHLKRAIDRLRKSGMVRGTKTLIVLGSWSRSGA